MSAVFKTNTTLRATITVTAAACFSPIISPNIGGKKYPCILHIRMVLTSSRSRYSEEVKNRRFPKRLLAVVRKFHVCTFLLLISFKNAEKNYIGIEIKTKPQIKPTKWGQKRLYYIHKVFIKSHSGTVLPAGLQLKTNSWFWSILPVDPVI